MAGTVSDEKIAKTRLLLDGDGTGDDRRLNIVVKQVLKWSATKPAEDDDEATKLEEEKTFAKLMASLIQCEWIDSKTKLVQEMNSMEAKNYEDLYLRIKEDIVKAKESIRDTNLELTEARKIRQNRLEYDAMAKVINQYPDRDVTGKKIEQVKQELDRLKECETSLEEKLEERKKQFHVLVNSIHNLQALLDKQDDQEEIICSNKLNVSNVSSAPEEPEVMEVS